MGFDGFGIWHIPILVGIIAAAAGIKRVTGHPGDHLHTAQALQLGGGVALFMLGDLLFRRTLAIGTVRWRAVAAVAGLSRSRSASTCQPVPTVPLGVQVSAAAQLAALVVLTGGALAVESRKRQQYGVGMAAGGVHCALLAAIGTKNGR